MDVVNIDTTIKPALGGAPNSRPWTFFASQINGTWRKGAANYVECGRLLAAARAELPCNAFNSMVKTKLDFDASVARKLTCIAANENLCAHVHNLPSCWSTMYELSQLTVDAFMAALADGHIHPRMSRKDAIALKPAKKAINIAPATTAAAPTIDMLMAPWRAASPEQRRAYLDQLGREEICGAMSPALLADFRDHIIGLNVAGASASSSFAIYATDKLHSALACAEQPNDENVKRMVTMLGRIIKQADTKGVARSNLLVVEGKPKGRK